jgi:hypothetical protein
MAGNGDGSAAQPAPTRTPRPRKTHTPGSNHTNNNGNNRAAFDLRVTLDCYGAPETVAVRNLGTEPVTLAKFETTGGNSLYKGSDAWTPNLSKSLKPSHTFWFYANARNAPAGTVFKGTKWSDDLAFLQDGTDGLQITVNETSQTFSKTCGPAPSGTNSASSSNTRKKRNRKHKQK